MQVTELRSGVVFEENGQIYQVLSYEHIKMGRGSANIKVRVKNLKNGSTTEKSFINGAKVNQIQIQKKDLQFLYKDTDSAHFMDPSSFEQVTIPISILGQDAVFLKDGADFSVSFVGKEPLSLMLPPKMVFKVVDTGGGARGNSATNIFKDATLENGIKTKIPLFIKEGDSVKIDTRSGEYSEKA
jgi:elongation factor P